MASSTNKSCTLTPSLIESEGTPQQIEGPYFVAGMPLRSNITYDTSDGSIQQGIPLHIVLHVFIVNENNTQQNINSSNGNVKNTSTNVCTPLSGARVDLWHANPHGVYSSIQNQNTVGKNFLRGYQITDKNGTVSFDTVYPGWYQGRAIHIHMKVSTFQGPIEKSDWTSQLYLNDSINQLVHTQPPYSNHGPVPLTNAQDMIYSGPSTDGLVKSDTGKHLMLNLTKYKQGYAGTFNIVLNAPNSTK
jgi:protocatechuate 3,4-dioxygenase beta subunit